MICEQRDSLGYPYSPKENKNHEPPLQKLTDSALFIGNTFHLFYKDDLELLANTHVQAESQLYRLQEALVFMRTQIKHSSGVLIKIMPSVY